MARADSRMIPLGTIAPDFTLQEPASGQWLTLEDCTGAQGVLVMFICNHCPYVKLYNAELAQLARDFMPQGIGIVAINSNDVDAYPEDAPDKMVLDRTRFAFRLTVTAWGCSDIIRAKTEYGMRYQVEK